MKCPYRFKFVQEKTIEKSERFVTDRFPDENTRIIESQDFADCYEVECACYKDGLCRRLQ